MAVRKGSKKEAAKKIAENGCKITWINPEEDALLALCNITLNGVTYYSVKLMQKDDDTNWLAFPSQKGKDGKYYSYVYVSDEKVLNDMLVMAIDAYESAE